MSDGSPYASHYYKRILDEVYCICKNTNISYNDVLDMEVSVRKTFVSKLKNEADTMKEEIANIEQSKSKKR